MRDYILLYINGQEQRISGAQAFQPASDYLRLDLGKCGTKVVCAEGDCGACSVMIGKLDSTGQKLDYVPVNSCIQYLYQLDCSHLVTVEGLRVEGQLNPVQQSMVDHNGAQCGYCTPGFVIAMCGLANDLKCADSCAKFPAGQKLTEELVKDSLTGNLCRCTGYEAIINAGMAMDLERFKPFASLYNESEIVASFKAHASQELLVEADGRRAFNPTSLASANKFLADNEKVVIVSGGTDVSVNMNKRDLVPKAIMSTAALPGLDDITMVESADKGKVMSIGARVTLRQLERAIKDLVPEFYDILWVYGSPQIRHAGTLAGNLANGSPIADSPPFLFVMDAEVEVTGQAGARRIAMADFYQGYKLLSLKKDELITRIFLPLPKADEILRLYKVSRRQHLDISAFTAAIRVTVKDNKIIAARVVFGGVGPVVKSVPEVEHALIGKAHELATYEAAGRVAREAIAPITDVRASKDYRLTLAENIMTKFYYESGAKERALACR
ncbi:MAG: FAD binding domain-containing protein [Candidatus Obscuribacterales bacterium]|jgi:xanthine dehydrogenase small subunit